LNKDFIEGQGLVDVHCQIIKDSLKKNEILVLFSHSSGFYLLQIAFDEKFKLKIMNLHPLNLNIPPACSFDSVG
jgi:hypothetical protein